MDTALTDADKHDGPAFRTISAVPSDLKSQLKEGGVITDAAFQSARAMPDVTTRAAFTGDFVPDGGLVMRVNGKAGVDISSISKNPAEGEILFPRNTEFKVTKIRQTRGGGHVAEVDVIGGIAESMRLPNSRSTRSAAVTSALESVESTEEAKAILREVYP